MLVDVIVYRCITVFIAMQVDIFVFVQGWNDFSFHGSPQIPTPNIDAIALNGAILNGFYSAPLCSPSRGTTLTGKFAVHIGSYMPLSLSGNFLQLTVIFCSFAALCDFMRITGRPAPNGETFTPVFEGN